MTDNNDFGTWEVGDEPGVGYGVETSQADRDLDDGLNKKVADPTSAKYLADYDAADRRKFAVSIAAQHFEHNNAGELLETAQAIEDYLKGDSNTLDSNKD